MAEVEREGSRWGSAPVVVAVIALLVAGGSVYYAYSETSTLSNQVSKLSNELGLTQQALSNSLGVNLTVLNGAAQEGKLVWYTGTSIQQNGPIISAFEAKYPFIKVEQITGPGPQVYARLLSEQSSGVYDADEIWYTDTALMNASAQSGLFANFVPVRSSNITTTLTVPHFLYPAFFYSFIIAYNTQLVPKADQSLLQTYAGAAQLAAKGFTSTWAIPSSGSTLAFMYYFLKGNPSLGSSWLSQFVANSGTAQVVGSVGTTCANVASGTIAFTVECLDSTMYPLLTSGAPVQWYYPNPDPVITMNMGILKHAPDPYAAELFENWALSPEGQAVIASVTGSVSVRNDLPSTGLSQTRYSWYTPPTAQYAIPWAVEKASNTTVINEFNTIFHRA